MRFIAFICVLAMFATGCAKEPKETKVYKEKPKVEKTNDKPTPTASPKGARAYFFENKTLEPVNRLSSATKQVAKASLEALFIGIDNPFYTTSILPQTKLFSAKLDQGNLTIDVSQEFTQSADEKTMHQREAQVVFTTTQFETVENVTLLVEGKKIKANLTREDYEDLSPAILIESPLSGDGARCPLRLVGTSNTFEAQFMIELDGTKVPVTATSGSGTRGNFDITLTCNLEGTHIVRVFEASAKDGAKINLQELSLNFSK